MGGGGPLAEWGEGISWRIPVDSYLLGDLDFQVNLLALGASARGRWVNPLAAAEKRRVQETGMVAWANHLAFPMGTQRPRAASELAQGHAGREKVTSSAAET